MTAKESIDKDIAMGKIRYVEGLLRSVEYVNNMISEIKKVLIKIEADKQQAHDNLNKLARLEEKRQEELKNLRYFQNFRDKVYAYLDKQEKDDKELLVDIFINNKTYDNVALKRYVSAPAIHKRVKHLLAKF